MRKLSRKIAKAAPDGTVQPFVGVSDDTQKNARQWFLLEFFCTVGAPCDGTR